MLDAVIKVNCQVIESLCRKLIRLTLGLIISPIMKKEIKSFYKYKGMLLNISNSPY